MSRNTSPRQERKRQLPHRISADPPRRRQEDPEVFAPKTGSEPDAPPTPKNKMKKNLYRQLGTLTPFLVLSKTTLRSASRTHTVE